MYVIGINYRQRTV